MITLNIHQREARLLERVAFLEHKNKEIIGVARSYQKRDQKAIDKLFKRITELEAALRNPHITRFEIDKTLEGSIDESADN